MFSYVLFGISNSVSFVISSIPPSLIDVTSNSSPICSLDSSSSTVLFRRSEFVDVLEKVQPYFKISSSPREPPKSSLKLPASPIKSANILYFVPNLYLLIVVE
jgi:hypothetical protein